MEDKIMIYVAGNPDAYPLEYYDSQTESYEGVIPELFREFSQESVYDVVYYPDDGEDHREEFAETLQVDLLSGYGADDAAPEGASGAELFCILRDGQEVSYYVFMTKAAPEGLRKDLTAYLASVSPAQISGYLTDTALYYRANETNYLTVYPLVFIIIILVCTIILMGKRYKRKLEGLRQYLETDAMTGLGNAEYFERKYDLLINNRTKTLYQIVYFYVDIDHLYRMGNSREVDEFLQYCAEKIREKTEGNEVLAKVSDNGFALLRFTGHAQSMEQWLSPVFASFHEYAVEKGRPFDLSVSVGVYPIKENDRNLKEMAYNALECAQMARREQKKYLVCTEELMRSVMQMRYLQESMNSAFEKKEFQLYLQFYVDAHSFRIVGGEALSRWNHPQKGIIMPGVFVPLMEQEKMISRLDYYCLERACEFLEELWQKRIDTFFISCNFSRETFSSVDFAQSCKRIMDAFHFPKELLIFEITESASVKNAAQVQRNILEMKKYGVRIALDDFGEGFSSFYDIQQYPIDGVKLDKGLIDDVLTVGGNAIVRAMIQVGHELGMTILAEGVETEEQVQALQKMNCDVIQGFRFFVPLPDWDAKKHLLADFEHLK